MSRLMLISGQHAGEELRVALVDNGRVEEYQVEVADSAQRRGNIYRGVVARVEQSLNAAFVDIGAERHGFLSIGDVVPEAYQRQPPDPGRQPRIDEVLQRGKPLLVQVTRDAEGSKGSALTTGISVAGRSVVLTPFDATRGLSRKVEDEKVRRKIKQRTQGIELPEGYGFIVRTNAVDQTKTELRRDLTALLRVVTRVLEEYARGSGPRVLYDDQDLVVRALRDYLDSAAEQVLVDDEQLLARAEQYVQAVMPRSKAELKLYRGRVPLFSFYNLEPQIDAIFQRTVPLPSGGSIVIDATEALVAIDVNSGKSTGAGSQGETALKTNLEAAEVVGRQLRLRDLGGLIVVDFIDMRASKDQRAVERAMREALRADRARVAVGRLSSNGLLEINRQRIHQAVSQRTHRICPMCRGVGRVASLERAGLTLVRRLHARAATGTVSAVCVYVTAELADAVNNGRRAQLAALERDFRIRIEVRADPRLGPSEERIEWTKRPQGDNGDAQPAVDRRGAAEPIVASAVVQATTEAPQDSPVEREEAETDEGELPTAAVMAPAARRKDRAARVAAAPALAASSAGEVADVTAGRRRRRRGRRGKRPNGVDAGAADAADLAPETASGASLADAPFAVAPAAGPPESPTAVQAVAEVPPAEDGAATRRVRSRGGRGRSRARRREPEQTAADAAARGSGERAAYSEDAGAPASPAAEPGAAARKPRRGRRRRKAARPADGDAPVAREEKPPVGPP